MLMPTYPPPGTPPHWMWPPHPCGPDCLLERKRLHLPRAKRAPRPPPSPPSIPYPPQPPQTPGPPGSRQHDQLVALQKLYDQGKLSLDELRARTARVYYGKDSKPSHANVNSGELPSTYRPGGTMEKQYQALMYTDFFDSPSSKGGKLQGGMPSEQLQDHHIRGNSKQKDRLKRG
ncbi:hypothetical protein CYMTET_35005 [Cymbomonas tetramitiformis]|uniref:Uncharacterized protein n=1 Tax=Cymbomonas tetramitiformis TaxID=36881 RepID=A0AAE0F9Z2_9CHLO|nr:hypothetical protein CYMTET_35005 [Cymbomonas tetramitiformis]